MAQIVKIENLSYELNRSSVAEFSWRTSPELSELLKSEHLKLDIRILEPKKFSFPYHFHRNAEEIFVILSGKVFLRTPDEFVELSEGDIAFFEIGAKGAHQLYNHTEQPCKYIDIRTTVGLDVCEYPDSGKINIIPALEIYQKEDQVEYYKNEDKVAEKWPLEIIIL